MCCSREDDKNQTALNLERCVFEKFFFSFFFIHNLHQVMDVLVNSVYPDQSAEVYTVCGKPILKTPMDWYKYYND